MYMKIRLPLSILLFSLLWLPLKSEAQNKQLYRNVEHALQSAGNLSGAQGPQNVIWIDGGERYSYFEFNSSTQTEEIRAYSPGTGEDELIFNPANHQFPETDRVFEFNSFQWSADYKYLVFQSDFSPLYRYSGYSDYYYYSLEDDSINRVATNAFTAELSPDGQSVGYGKNGELFIYDLATGEEKQLTFDSEENLFNGRFGWVYEEEFGKVQAWEWSGDSRYIAYWQTDERHVELFRSTDYEGQYPEYLEIPYPKVGAENPTVRVGVVDVETGENRWMSVEIGDGYIPRIYWTSRPGVLAVTHLNRAQNELKLYLHDVNTGDAELIMEETSENGWIDVYDFFEGIDDYFFFPEGREEFFWISDRDGWNHLYRYNYAGELLNQVTSGEWVVTNVHAMDPETETVWYESTEESPLERHLYSISFDGDEKERLTQSNGYHTFSMGPNGKYFIDSWSNTETPLQVELYSSAGGGELIEILENNDQVETFTNQFAYSPREIFRFTGSNGVELDGYIIKPVNFDPEESYPLLLNVYGGPGAQGVFNEFEADGWVQYLAQQGYVIANINNRGSGAYGRDFMESVYKNLGHLEAEDFAETARYLSNEYSWIDGERMAIRGHSYGGYMAAMTAVLHPRVFRASIVTAPVTDWSLYDTIYTERYMGLLEDNADGYYNSSVMAHAASLDGKMLAVHSSLDENVHVQNTMQMIRAFTDAGKDIDLRIYPPGDHGVAYNLRSYFLLYKTYTDYLNTHVK